LAQDADVTGSTHRTTVPPGGFEDIEFASSISGDWTMTVVSVETADDGVE
jgi:hypothetical protein